MYRSDPLSFDAQLSEIQVVPDSGENADIADCVVPISKLNFDIKLNDSASDHFAGRFNIESGTESLVDSYFSLETATLGHCSSELSNITPSSDILFPGLSLPHSRVNKCFSHSSKELDGARSLPNSRRVSTIVSSRNHTLDDGIQILTTISPVCSRSSEQLHFSTTDITIETPRMRRNSSGSETRMRRHSSAPFRSVSFISHVRHRRTSHDVRDEQCDLLERLRVAATRRRSVSAPFQASARLRPPQEQ